MNEEELLSENELKQLLEEAAQDIPENLNLWANIKKQAETAKNETFTLDRSTFTFLPEDKTRISGSGINWPKVTRIGLGLAAGLALAFVVLSVILNTGKNETHATVVAISAPPPSPTAVSSQITGTLQATLRDHTDAVRIVAWSPDGKTLASGSEDKTVKLWDPSGKLITTISGFSDPIYSLIWTPDGLLATPENKTWNSTGKLVGPLNNDLGGFSPDGKMVAYRVKSNLIELRRVSDNSVVSNITIPAGFLGSIAWSPDGKTLAIGGQNADQAGPYNIRVWLWNTATGLEWTSLPAYFYPINSLAWSPDSKLLAVTAKGAHQAFIWKGSGTSLSSVNTSGTLNSIALDEYSDEYVVWSIAWSPNGKLLAGGCSDNKIRLWDANGKLVATISGHTDEVWSVAWSPDGKTLASGSGDKTVRLWKINY